MSDPTDTLIVTESKRRFFIMLPLIVDDMNLSPLAFRLYAHIVRRAGEDGECWENTRNLAKACNMSPAAVSRGKKQLQAAGLIKVESKSRHGEFPYHLLTICDIWETNVKKYSPCSPLKQDLFPQEDGTCSPGDTKVNPSLSSGTGKVKIGATSAPRYPRAKSVRAGGDSPASSSVSDLINHPAIQAIKQVSNYFPRKNRTTYQTLIDWIGDSPKIKRLEWAHAVWTSEYTKDPAKVIEWVKHGYIEGYYYEPRRPILPMPEVE